MMTCTVHKVHVPRPLLIELHHVWPLAMLGPDVDSNKVAVCVQGHFNIHTKLAELIRGGQMTPGGTKTERALAQRGFDEWVAAGKPGTPVYEITESSK
jgi:hypothetical protein